MALSANNNRNYNSMDKGRTSTEKGTELKKVEVNGKNQNQNRSEDQPSTSAPITCTPDVCRQARARFQPPDLQDSPWHTKKTYFFLGFILLFIIWAVVFALLLHYEVV